MASEGGESKLEPVQKMPMPKNMRRQCCMLGMQTHPAMLRMPVTTGAADRPHPAAPPERAECRRRCHGRAGPGRAGALLRQESPRRRLPDGSLAPSSFASTEFCRDAGVRQDPSHAPKGQQFRYAGMASSRLRLSASQPRLKHGISTGPRTCLLVRQLTNCPGQAQQGFGGRAAAAIPQPMLRFVFGQAAAQPQIGTLDPIFNSLSLLCAKTGSAMALQRRRACTFRCSRDR